MIFSESAKIEIVIFAKSLLWLFLQQLLDATGLNDLWFSLLLLFLRTF